MKINITPDSTTIQSDQAMSILFEVSSSGKPIDEAMIRVKSNIGNFSQDSATTFENGTQKIKYLAPVTSININATIYVTVTKPGYLTTNSQFTIKILGVVPVKDTNTLQINWNRYTLYSYVIGILVLLIVIFLVAIWKIRKRRK